MEHRLYEGAVMVAYAMHLLRTTSATHVRIHPDGEHGKQFDFTGWLLRRGFEKVSSMGTTSYGGLYRTTDGLEITVNPKSGQGDVIADLGSAVLSAECKGWNHQHSAFRTGVTPLQGALRNRGPAHGQRDARAPGCRRAIHGGNVAAGQAHGGQVRTGRHRDRTCRQKRRSDRYCSVGRVGA